MTDTPTPDTLAPDAAGPLEAKLATAADELIRDRLQLHDDGMLLVRVGDIRAAVAAIRRMEAEAARIKEELTECKVALVVIRRSTDKLYKAVLDGIYDSRSVVGDEVLNMTEVFADLGELIPIPKECP